jgi:hypothetical protein
VLLFIKNKSLCPSCSVQLPVVPSTLLPDFVLSLLKCKSAVYMLSHLLDVEPKSCAASVVGKMSPTVVKSPELSPLIQVVVVVPSNPAITNCLSPVADGGSIVVPIITLPAPLVILSPAD